MDPPTSETLVRFAKLFEAHDLPFMVVGAFAVMAHGMPRTSGDLDIVIHLPFSERERVKTLISGESEGR
ncbi:MAG: hypothetical protein ACYDDF_14305 [Thermoplasmatota archaeon]